MSFLLDTNILSAHLKGTAPSVESKFLLHTGQLYTSTLNLGELLTWAHRSAKAADRLKEIGVLLNDVQLLTIDRAVAECFAAARSHQLRTGVLTPVVDLFIAATALAHNFTVVTHNTADFAHIPNLRVVDWI